MFGSVLKEKVESLKNKTKYGPNAFWITLRDIAVEDIKNCYPNKVDSINAVPIYYNILCNNLDCIPDEFKEILKSNKQERFRVVNRNMWTSNAFHTDGLANQPHIKTEREVNYDKKGDRIVYQWDPN